MNATEKLTAAIAAFKAERTKENVMKVLMQLMTMAKDGEQVYTPIRIQVRNYKKDSDLETLYQVVTVGNRKLHVCYTTPQDAAAAKDANSLAPMKWTDLLFAVVKQPAVDGLAVNPYGDHDFVLSKELCTAILQELKMM